MKTEAPCLNGTDSHEDTELISERIVITLPPALLQSIQDYRFGNRINSQSAAVRRLIEMGLQVEKRKKPTTLI